MLQFLESKRAIRKTADTQRVSVIDVIGAVTGYPRDQSGGMFRRLLDAFPEIRASCTYFKFPGRGRRESPVVDIRSISIVIALLPGRAASIFRKELLDNPQCADEYLDAEAILRERGLAREQLGRLASEFGKDLLLVAKNEARQIPTANKLFGPETREINQYRRVADAKLIEDVFQSFCQRPLYKRIAADDPVTLQRHQILAEQGRGRGKKQRTT